MDLAASALIAVVAFLAAGSIKGLTGLGLPTVAVGLMTLALDPRTAISLMMLPMIASNIWQLYRSGEIRRTAQRYTLFAVVLGVGVTVTAVLTKDVGDQMLLGFLGAVILLFVGVSVAGWMPRIPDRFDRVAQVAFALFAGGIGGLTAAWAPPMAMYLSARRVEKDEFVRASGFLISVGSVPLAIAYFALGFLDGPLTAVSVAMLVPTFAGFALGEAIRARISGEGFRNVFLAVFALFGLNLLRRAIFVG